MKYGKSGKGGGKKAACGYGPGKGNYAPLGKGKMPKSVRNKGKR